MVAGQNEKAGVQPAGGEADRKALKLNVSSSSRVQRGSLLDQWFVQSNVSCSNTAEVPGFSFFVPSS